MPVQIKGQTYYYTVSAVNSAGEGVLSVEAQATPGTTPGAPGNLQVKTGRKYTNLTWSAPTDNGGFAVTGYRIYRATASGQETFFIGVGNVTYYNDTNVNYSETYYYRVSAVNERGEGTLSAEASGTIPAVPQEEASILSQYWRAIIILAIVIIISIIIVLVRIKPSATPKEHMLEDLDEEGEYMAEKEREEKRS